MGAKRGREVVSAGASRHKTSLMIAVASPWMQSAPAGAEGFRAKANYYTDFYWAVRSFSTQQRVKNAVDCKITGTQRSDFGHTTYCGTRDMISSSNTLFWYSFYFFPLFSCVQCLHAGGLCFRLDLLVFDHSRGGGGGRSRCES